MRQPQDPTSSIRWLPFRSESSEPIPPFAVMRTTGFDEATGYYKVNQPNADSLSQVLINGASCVPALGEGQCHRTEPATVLYETNGGTPASDDDYGTQSGSWKLHAGKKGFRVLGVSSESNVAEFTFLGASFKELNDAGGRRPVRAATTANITLSGAQTIDGVSIAVGEDVLVKDQSTTANNGIYTAASSTWTRRADADSWDELVGALVVVTEGTTLADTLWMCTSNAGGTLGSTAVAWQQVAADGVSAIVRVRLATTAQITLASDLENGDTIDGVVLATGDRVLVKDQTIGPSSNGVYVVASSGAPSRATDMDTWDELITPQVYVEAGTVNVGTLWWCMEGTGGTIDSTTVRWRSGIKAGAADGTPAYSGVVSLLFDQADGFALSQTDTGAVQVDISPASYQQYGVLSDIFQTDLQTSSAETAFETAIKLRPTLSGGTPTLKLNDFITVYGDGAANRFLGCEEDLSLKIGLHRNDGGSYHNSFVFGPGSITFVDYKVFLQTAYTASESDYTEALTATVSGLSFLKGWYVGGSVTVSAGSVTGLDESIDDRVAALLVAGTGIGLSYNDGAGTLTISCTITQYTDEMARDALGTALTAGTGIAITPNDGADTITVALSFLGLEALTDPGADRILFWDDSAGAFTWLTLGSGLSITTTTLTATGSITGPGSSTDNAIVRWNGTGGTAIQDSAVIINDDGTVEVNATVAATNTATTEILHLHTMSEGTPDDNFGSVIVIHLEDDTTEDVKASAQSTYWVDATHASRKSRWVLSTADAAGEREIMRGEASGSAPMIGFLGANAAIRQTGDVGTAMVTNGLMSGTPTFAWANLSGTKSIAWSELTSVPLSLAGNIIVLQDQKSTGTAGGTFSAGTRTRVLNTEVVDTGSDCSLASNQFTLTAGTYEILAFAPCYAVDRNQAWLQNATAGTTLVLGSSGLAYSAASAQVQHHSIIAGRFTVAASQALEIQHYGQTTSNTYGFGVESSSGKTEVYTTVFLRRVA